MGSTLYAHLPGNMLGNLKSLQKINFTVKLFSEIDLIKYSDPEIK